MKSSDQTITVLLPSNDLGVSNPADRHQSLIATMKLFTQYRTYITAWMVGLMGIALVYCRLTTPKYQASATLEVLPSNPIVSLTSTELATHSQKNNIEHYRTIVAKLSLPSLADSVLSSVPIHRHFAASGTTTPDSSHTNVDLSKSKIHEPARNTNSSFKHATGEISAYLSALQILPMHETNLVSITASASDPYIAQLIANTHSQTFVRYLNNNSRAKLTANLNLLKSQALALNEQIQQSEQALTSYAKQHQLILLKSDNSSDLPHQQIQSLATKLADATANRIKSETALKRAAEYSLKESSFLDNDIIYHLRGDLSQAEAEYASLGSQVTDAYPGMRELKAKISSLTKAIQIERNQNLRSLKTQFEADLANEHSLKKQIDTEKLKVHRSARAMLEYDVLRRRASSLKKLHATLQQEITATETAKAIVTPNVSIIDYAQEPLYPSSPKTNIVVILAAVLGLAGGLITSYIKHLVKNSIETIEEAKTEFSLPVLGALPHFSDDHRTTIPLPAPIQPTLGAKTMTNIPSLVAPQSILAEALRTIRANVLLSSLDYPPRIILISSALKGEGKTTIVSNLAITLARANLRTLVIDADLRAAQLSDMMQPLYTSETNGGVSDILLGNLSPDRAVLTTQIPGLDFIPAGTRTTNPAELLGTPAMKALLEEQRQFYDFILLDSPPVLPVADGLLLSRTVDGVLFVIRCNKTSRMSAHLAKEHLQNAKARILGLILNDIPSSTNGYETGPYGSNYLYQTESNKQSPIVDV